MTTVVIIAVLCLAFAAFCSLFVVTAAMLSARVGAGGGHG